MKKSLFLGLILICAAMLSVPLAVERVNEGKEQIVITQEVLSGDPEAAAGVTLRIPSRWDGHLFWETEYLIGGGEDAESKFSFSGKRLDRSLSGVSAGLSFQYGSKFGSIDTGDDSPLDAEAMPYPEIFREAARRAAPGETYSGSIEIGDYYANYPLTFTVEGHSVKQEGRYDEACRYLTEYFQISAAGDRLELTVEKNAKEEIVSYQGKVVYGDGRISLTDSYAEGREGIYYTYCLEDTQTRESVDRGQNQGIFYFPFTDHGDGFWSMDLKKVSRLCALPQGAVPLKMAADEERGRLYLAVREKEGYRLCIYKKEEEGLALAWEIPVDRGNLSGNLPYLGEIMDNRTYGAEESLVVLPYFCGMFLVEGGVLLTWSDGSFSFVAQEEGEYRWWCDGMFPAAQEGEYGAVVFPWENICFFDGDRLILGAYEGKESLNVTLAVYDRHGRIYSGRYRHSSQEDADGGYGIRSGILPGWTGLKGSDRGASDRGRGAEERRPSLEAVFQGNGEEGLQ